MEATVYLGNKPIIIEVPDSVLTKAQKKSEERIVDNMRYVLHLRYDDHCGNGNNSFSATVDIYEKGKSGRWEDAGGGAAHEVIAKIFPEYADLLKYHLTSSNGPMHYLSNSLYMASNRDHNGKLKGEPIRWEKKLHFSFAGQTFPIGFDLDSELDKFLANRPYGEKAEIVPVASSDPKTFKPKCTFKGMPEVWYKCPFDSLREAEEMKEALDKFDFQITATPTAWSEGKEPNLVAARNAAVWPEAELSDFTAENLLARLPALLIDFKAKMEALGFVY